MYFLHRRLYLIVNLCFTAVTAFNYGEKIDQPKLAEHDSSVLDLVFAMDTTGSMAGYIKSATEHIRSIVDKIVISEKCDVRLALVEYRDHPPQDKTFVTRVHDFTANAAEMKSWLKESKAEGGGDTPEAVADALHEVTKLSWRPDATKICILISDAPPHGLDSSNDAIPNGCPDGHDPIKIVRDMAQNYITLYTIGVEPSIVPYRDFFKTLAYITGGQYVPMRNAQLLAQVVIGGVREEISLARLMQEAQEDIVREMREAMAEGLDDEKTSDRISVLFSSNNIRAHQMSNKGGETPYNVTNLYSKCEDMEEMKAKYQLIFPDRFEHYDDELGEEAAMSYDFSTDQEVSVEQAKRIVQKMKLHL